MRAKSAGYRSVLLTAVAASALALSACTIPTETAAGVTAAPTTTAGELVRSATLQGKTVFLDPGHNGANDAGMSAPVPTGRGGTKECQTTGTSTDGGFPEHSLNWEVVAQMRTELENLGARVLLSRADDTSVAPCVDRRAADANASGADVVVAIHADGAAPDQHGFHVCFSAPPLNAVQAGASVAFAKSMRDALETSGLTPSTYVGAGGLLPRGDLSGLNLSERPSILVELGNMRNADEARAVTSAEGRARYAQAVVFGIVRYLDGR
ncbi:N-acetylmuramoyl-L-alanine amidase [Rhodococcus maanshanensis]|uniref:N-acetylmuramoyl-L-alanine amidase n=1 Tax=Rhodococcus maanshanensis TaxID=183556 RepID=A0A1H7I4A7_9NOCA|nr:N-acetylmuramoyl-L-alanine amidase [Rhodococcus maanshanensis]